MKRKERIAEAMKLIERYGQIEGEHHKTWVIDQVARALLKNSASYQVWRRRMRGKVDESTGLDEYGYDEGIAP